MIFFARNWGAGLLGAVAAPDNDVGVLLVGANPGVDKLSNVDFACRQQPSQQLPCRRGANEDVPVTTEEERGADISGERQLKAKMVRKVGMRRDGAIAQVLIELGYEIVDVCCCFEASEAPNSKHDEAAESGRDPQEALFPVWDRNRDRGILMR